MTVLLHGLSITVVVIVPNIRTENLKNVKTYVFFFHRIKHLTRKIVVLE